MRLNEYVKNWCSLVTFWEWICSLMFDILTFMDDTILLDGDDQENFQYKHYKEFGNQQLN